MERELSYAVLVAGLPLAAAAGFVFGAEVVPLALYFWYVMHRALHKVGNVAEEVKYGCIGPVPMLTFVRLWIYPIIPVFVLICLPIGSKPGYPVFFFVGLNCWYAVLQMAISSAWSEVRAKKKEQRFRLQGTH